jgi:uncharacterized protein YwqG
MSASAAALRARAAAQLADAGLGSRAQAIAALGAPCVRLRTSMMNDDEIGVGASKIGGSPDLPPDAAWPEWRGKPLSFLAQLDLREVAEHTLPGVVPDGGVLSFFCDSALDDVGVDPEDAGGWRVMWHPGRSQLARRSAPPADGVEVFPACILRISAEFSYPDWQALAPPLGMSGDDAYEIDETIHVMRGEPIHQLLGIPRPVQNDPALDCQYSLAGLYTSGFDAERARQVEPGAAEWKLLFQLDSDDNADMMWGDSGMLYFMIHQADLREWRFDRTWMVFQCF